MGDGSIELRKVKGEVNPADLFTKHLPSRERVHKLLALFNCRYLDGRPLAAPQLRPAEDVTPVLELDPSGVTVEVDGEVFPAIKLEGELVAEARDHGLEQLPHQFGAAISKLFPRAIAVEDPGDADLHEDDELHERGMSLGTQRRCRSAMPTN